MAPVGIRGPCLEASSEIELRPGEEHHLVLGSLGSAGYAWEFEVRGSPGVIGIRSGPPGPTSDIQPSVLQTYSVEHTYVITALAPGKAEVRFLLRRPWEKGKPPARAILVHVIVIER